MAVYPSVSIQSTAGYIMHNKRSVLRIAILGGGPSGLFIYKRILESGRGHIEVDIFEKNDVLGEGMPYGREGAGDEHITNVSGNEIPLLVTSVHNWIQTLDTGTLSRFGIDQHDFSEYKVLPRLLFGRYLTHQFKMLEQQGKELGLITSIHYRTKVADIADHPETGTVSVLTDDGSNSEFDKVVICTGHFWPQKLENKQNGYFDSPYPPAKLAFKANHAIAIRGSSLTAIDALRTLARSNGRFSKKENKLTFTPHPQSAGFRMIMHSKDGLLPAVRFHLEDSHLGKDAVLSDEEIAEVRAGNDGFLPLDYVYKRNFLEGLQSSDPDFYERIKDMTIEEFVEEMMQMREKLPPFVLLKAELAEAEKSIERRQSVYWKEMLGVLSFAMNYPAKYFSAEDMQRLQKTLMPLISIVIAFAPQSSISEMMALYEAGVLDIVNVGDDSRVEPAESGGVIYHYTDTAGEAVAQHYPVFVDCIGQPHLNYYDLPYPSLLSARTVSPARLKFQDQAIARQQLAHGNENVIKGTDGLLYLQVPGIAINDHFQVVDAYGALNERIYMMAVPFIGGYNPDYSGLDFSEEASARIVKRLVE